MADRKTVVEDLVAAIGQLQGLGYVIGIGSVDVRPDTTVVFHLEGGYPALDADLKKVGFRHPYQVDYRPARHYVHPPPPA